MINAATENFTELWEYITAGNKVTRKEVRKYCMNWNLKEKKDLAGDGGSLGDSIPGRRHSMQNALWQEIALYVWETKRPK